MVTSQMKWSAFVMCLGWQNDAGTSRERVLSWTKPNRASCSSLNLQTDGLLTYWSRKQSGREKLWESINSQPHHFQSHSAAVTIHYILYWTCCTDIKLKAFRVCPNELMSELLSNAYSAYSIYCKQGNQQWKVTPISVYCSFRQMHSQHWDLLYIQLQSEDIYTVL